MRSLAPILVAPAVAVNPLSKVFELMDGLTAKIKAEGEAEAKAYKEYFDWCDDTSKNAQFEIKTATSEKEELEATIGELSSSISASTTKIEELSAAIASDTAELKEATTIREKEVADFQKAESELVDTVDTLERAVAILEREMAKAPGSFAQIDTSNTKMLANALGAVVEAAAFSGHDKNKLMALVQSKDDDGDSDLDMGAPAAATYESKSGSIVDVLEDMKDKAESELDELRKAEGNAKHNFNMLKQSLEDQIGADTTDLDQEKSSKAGAEEGKATAEGDLVVTTKELADVSAELATASSNCMQTAADHEATVTARTEELGVIAEARKIIAEATGGAASQTYSLLQISSRSDLKKSEVITVIKNLAKTHHSSALAQLASRVDAVVKYGASGGEDVFTKIKGLISDMITKLEKEAEEDATEKAYCDEELAKTEAKHGELTDDISKLSAKIDKAAATSAKRKEEVKELQAELAALAKEQTQLDAIRSEEHGDYSTAKADLEAGINGVQKALGVLRDYYGGASFVQGDFSSMMQQPAMPEKHAKAGGAGSSIINLLEVCESDFSSNLAKEETQEADAVSEYEKVTQENKVSKTTKDQDVKYKTQEFKSLDKEISELSGDKGTASTELAAVNEYYGKLKDRCIAKPQSYEERKARREEEIAGLKEALQVLEEETAFVQRKRKGGLRGRIQ
jgi:predicted  nucleic acid-binding Zn-ribbon protein